MTDQQLLLISLLAAALAVPASWLAPPRWQPRLTALIGFALLLVLAPSSAALLGAGALLVYGLPRQLPARAALLASVVIVAVTLLVFMAVAQSAGKGIDGRVVLPFGLAFYALRLIHYAFEHYKGGLREHRFDEFLGYLLLPSLLTAGPIHRFDEYLRDLRRKRWDPQLASAGAERVLYGLAKIIVLGNFVIPDLLAPALTFSGAAAVYGDALRFWIRLYVLFSGYSDVGVGFAALAGFRVRENFLRPFAARNIADFWQRWHLSLSSWCRDYVFTPVQSATRNQAVAVIASMIVLGLWHDLSLRYVLWGAYHGLGIVVFRAFDARFGARIDAWRGAPALLWRLAATLTTLHFVIFSFYVTRAAQQLLQGGG